MKIPLWLKKKRIGVLCGGLSEESGISRRTGRAILRALLDAKLDAFGIEADRNLPEKLKRQRINYCFIALHGRTGEDGTVQGLCEVMGIPYSGSGVLASALSMNKAAAKWILENAGVPTPPFIVCESSSLSAVQFKMAMPWVVKPVDSGSAIGVRIVRKKSELRLALKNAGRYSREILIEKFVEGKEITAAILGERVLPLIEIVPKRSFYDFEAKYEKGMSDHLIPARISRSASLKIQELACRVHQALGCRGFSRVDFILDRSGKPWFLELNSIPGMTETSLFPEAAKAAGLGFFEMLMEMVRFSDRK